MRVPLSWLREYVDIDEAPSQLVERLPMIGLGVEGMEVVGDDQVIDIEIAYNRPDLLSLIGIAREVAAWGRRDVRLPSETVAATDPPAATITAVEIADAGLCPRYIAHVIADVRVGPSPHGMAARLEAAGIRSINNIVDATNYVMIEWGQPLHAFDLDTLLERRIVVRPAVLGERLVTLDGLTRELDGQVLVIADGRRPVALAGIMGGAETEISPSTRTVLLEAASFSQVSVRRTSRRFGLRTEATARFERGVDPEGVSRAAARAAQMIAELTGGRLLRDPVDCYPAPAPRPTITLRLARIPRLLGIEVPVGAVTAILSRLGLDVERTGEVVRAVPPVGRRDLEREEDLIEEIARHYGYDHIPEAMPVEIMQQGGRSTRLETESAVRDALVRSGLTEALTVSLVNPRLLDRLRLASDDPWRRAVPLLNPYTTDHTHLRPCLMAGLLEAVRVNVSRRREAVHLFEIGRVWAAHGDEIVERRSLAIAMSGPWLEGVWDQPAQSQEVTVFHLKGILEALVRELHAGDLSVQPLSNASPLATPPWLHPARAGAVALSGHLLGLAGELHPEVAASFDLSDRTYVCELDLEVLLDRTVLQPRFSGLPRFPAVRRDVAVVAPVDLPHADVQASLREIVGDLLESVELFDVYTGPPLEPGTRNLAYALAFRAPDRTLTGEEIDALITRIHDLLPVRLPVSIRT